MKKSIFFPLVMSLCFIAIILNGCGTSTTPGPTTSTEKPIAALFADTSLSDFASNDTFITQGIFESGYEFTVTKSGNVTQLGAEIPVTKSVRVTLWEIKSTDTTILAQATIAVIANTPKYVTLSTPVALSIGKTYGIASLAEDGYTRSQKLGGSYPYPILKGHITITKYGYAGSTFLSPAIYLQTFPSTYLLGLMDFTYETTN